VVRRAAALEKGSLMTTKVFTRDEWISALEGLIGTYRIFAPVKDGDFHNFKLLETGKKPDFNYQNSRLSPKAIVYPRSERMFEYSLDEKESDAHIVKEAEKDYSPQAIVGIRPCDVRAFQIVKKNFDNPEFRDPWWVRRFESSVIVGLGCNEPCATCFCTSAGSGPFDEEGMDVLLYDMGERFLAKGLTEKGEKLLEEARGGAEADEGSQNDAEKLAESSREKIKTRISTDKLGEKDVIELFDAPFWERVAFACLNCGTCTYLCPTCWCFDIQDEVYGKEGDRIRNWDSCMFPLFTFHGSGHNPRDQKFKRVRQRFMHKLKYYVDKYQNGIQCSGCGRCVRYCPVNIDIREVCQQMNSL
jgi:sulfhydrogenase subunit beta (sulfur reductase)